MVASLTVSHEDIIILDNEQNEINSFVSSVQFVALTEEIVYKKEADGLPGRAGT